MSEKERDVTVERLECPPEDAKTNPLTNPPTGGKTFDAEMIRALQQITTSQTKLGDRLEKIGDRLEEIRDSLGEISTPP